MTGIKSYSTTASENVSANTGINWDEGMPPATVNNSARQNMADARDLANDYPWFEYGVGSKVVAAVYASSTSFTFSSSTDATSYWHIGRRVRAVGSATGTIYGTVTASAFATNVTTVTVAWDSGSLSNETLTVSAGLPVTGNPVGSASGTFTPSLGGTATYTSQSGTYTKIGSLVYFNIQLVVNNLGTGSTTTISGLPFTASSVIKSLSIGIFNNIATSCVWLGAYIPSATATINFALLASAGTGVTAAATVFQNSTQINVSGSYEVA